MSNTAVKSRPEIHESWYERIGDEFQQDYFAGIKSFILQQRRSGRQVFPPGPLIFNAFKLTPFDQVRVVVLGQDPYHGPGQAHGLCFSVPEGVKPPPSLVNIYKEIEQATGESADLSNGNLEHWARQGVLLLNAVLTVNAHQAASHRKAGWERFTDAVIRTVSEQKEGVVFMLWGSFARSKKSLIDSGKHLVLEAVHPSPLSAHKGFFGCGHFNRTNAFLSSRGEKPIHWLDRSRG